MQLFIILCIPLLSFIYSIFGFCKKPKKWKRYIPFFIYFIFIVICSFTLRNGSDYDLVRYYQAEAVASQMSCLEAIEYPNNNLYVINFLYWLFGNLGIPQLLPAFSISVVMSVVVYITCDLAEQYEMLHLIKFIVPYQLMILPFMDVMVTVRSGMAFALAIFLAYLEIVREKRAIWIYIGYIACILIHPFSFVFVLFRIVAVLPHVIGKTMIILPLFLSVGILFIYENVWSIVRSYPFLQLIIQKAYGYMTSTNSTYGVHAEGSGFFLANKIIMCTEAILMIVMVYYLLYKPIVVERKYVSFLLFFNMINILALSMMPAHSPMYWRFTTSGYACVGAFIIPLIKEYRRACVPIRLLFYALGMTAIPAFLLQAYWTRTYTDSFITWGTDFLTTNIFTVFYQVMVNLNVLT